MTLHVTLLVQLNSRSWVDCTYLQSFFKIITFLECRTTVVSLRDAPPDFFHSCWASLLRFNLVCYRLTVYTWFQFLTNFKPYQISFAILTVIGIILIFVLLIFLYYFWLYQIVVFACLFAIVFAFTKDFFSIACSIDCLFY